MKICPRCQQEDCDCSVDGPLIKGITGQSCPPSTVPKDGETILILETKWFMQKGSPDLIRACTRRYDLLDRIKDEEDGDGPQWRPARTHSEWIVAALYKVLRSEHPCEIIDLRRELDQNGLLKPILFGRCVVNISTPTAGEYRVLTPSTDGDHCTIVQRAVPNSCEDWVWETTLIVPVINIIGSAFSQIFPSKIFSIQFDSSQELNP